MYSSILDIFTTSNNPETPDLKLKGSHTTYIALVVLFQFQFQSLLFWYLFDYNVGPTWKPTLSINNKQVGPLTSGRFVDSQTL